MVVVKIYTPSFGFDFLYNLIHLKANMFIIYNSCILVA